MVTGVAAFVLLPITILALYSVSAQWNYPDLAPTSYSMEWYEYFFHYEGGLAALILSVEIACASTALALLLGVPAGYVLARHRFKGQTVLEMLFLAKNAVPVIVLGVGTASLFIALGLYDTFVGILLAHAVGGLPLMIWTCTAAFQGIGNEYEEAARDVGAGFIRVFFEILLPMAKPGIIAGTILVFLFSMDEFTITLLISGAQYTTLPLRLYSTLQQGYIEPASASAVVLLMPSLIFLVLVGRFLRLSEVGPSLHPAG
jgi:putative spermidine/putrescine transport system permease protein